MPDEERYVTITWDAEGNAHLASKGASPIMLFGAAHVIVLHGERLMGAVAAQQASDATKGKIVAARSIPGGLRDS